MKCAYGVVSTYILITLFGNTKGEVCYKAEFSEDVLPCEDFENEQLKCEPLELGLVEGKGELALQGNITVLEDIVDGTVMNVDIWKILDIGKEYLYHAQGDICGSLEDEKTPWFPMLDAMKIKKCPIAVDTYIIADMSISLDHCKDMMSHEMCGQYEVQLSLAKELDKKSCHGLGIYVSEYEC